MKTTAARKPSGASLGRPREFDEDKVLLAAAHAFWERGYHATSVDDICAATGLLRGSLYGAYGDKHGIFVASLNRYCETRVARAAESLSGTPSRETLRRGLAYYFESALDLNLAAIRPRRTWPPWPWSCAGWWAGSNAGCANRPTQAI